MYTKKEEKKQVFNGEGERGRERKRLKFKVCPEEPALDHSLLSFLLLLGGNPGSMPGLSPP